MARRPVFLDTSYLVALSNLDDPHHDRSKKLDERLLRQGVPIVSHWGIMLEIADGFARLSRRSKGMDLLQRMMTEERYRIEPISSSLFNEALDRYCTRADKEWSLTDCISFVLMEQLKLKEALTADNHFRQAEFRALLLEA